MPILASWPQAAASKPHEVTCPAGAYRLVDGQVLAVAPASDDRLRYQLSDGTTGHLYPAGEGRYEGGPGWAAPPPPVATELLAKCAHDGVVFRRPDRAPEPAEPVPLAIKDTFFQSGNLTLAGRLVLPVGAGPVPVVVMVHGSRSHSYVREERDPFALPARGVGVFVYDKRGTGRSEGSYTQNFDVLANDAVAALAEARRLAGARASRIGFWGASQGGWVAPLAATRAKVDFMVVSYGLTEGPAGEDREQVFFELRKAGYGADAIAKAREVTAATTKVIASGFTTGFAEVAAMKEKYGDEPWFGMIKGEYTGAILRAEEAEMRVQGPAQDRGTTWAYDPEPALVAFTKPMLWILAGDDHDAPADTTLARLQALQAEREALDLAVYPATDHGIVHFHEAPDGTRTPLRYAASYQDLVVGWVTDGALKEAHDVILYPSKATRARAVRDPRKRRRGT